MKEVYFIGKNIKALKLVPSSIYEINEIIMDNNLEKTYEVYADEGDHIQIRNLKKKMIQVGNYNDFLIFTGKDFQFLTEDVFEQIFSKEKPKVEKKPEIKVCGNGEISW